MKLIPVRPHNLLQKHLISCEHILWATRVLYARCAALCTAMGFMNYKPLSRSKTVSQMPLERVNENAAEETSAHWAHVHAVLEHLITKISLAPHTRNSCKMLKEKSLFRVQLECAFLA